MFYGLFVVVIVVDAAAGATVICISGHTTYERTYTHMYISFNL